MKIIKSKEFKPNNAWDSISISNMNGITTKLHWTNEPYKWHINDGVVKMYYKLDGVEQDCILNSGDIFYANIGCEHYAKPIGEARILVVEKEGSV